MKKSITLNPAQTTEVEEAFANYILMQIGEIERCERDDGEPEEVKKVLKEAISKARNRMNAAYHIAGYIFSLSTYDIDQIVLEECIRGAKLKQEHDLKEEVKKEINRIRGV